MTVSPMSNHTASTVPSPLEAIAPRTPRMGPTKDDWEHFRPQITRLYQDENMKLKDVAIVMKEYGLNAT